MKKNCLLFFGVFFSFLALGQNNLALPEIINYSKSVYNAGTQNWGIIQDKHGIVYFANNEGLLSFDGTYWKSYPLPNKTVVRSVAIGADGKIFVGGQDELGFFSPNKNGRLIYQSLLPQIDKRDQSFADVWNIVVYKNSTFFRSTRKIFQYTDNKITTYTCSDWRFMGMSNGLLIAQDSKKGILQFKNGYWIPFQKMDVPPEALITSFTSLNPDSSIITTLKHGCFIFSDDKLVNWSTPLVDYISAKQIYSSTLINNQNLLLATSLEGCYLLDKAGKLISTFSRKEGLQNNNVLSVFSDKDKNLWLGLDNGIDFISINNAVKHIYPDPDKDASGYSSIIYQNQLYLGTSNGLYKTSLSPLKDLSFVKGAFESVSNTGGQVWNLSEVNEKLLLGHHEGSFMVDNNKAIPLDKSVGYWTFLPFSNIMPSSLMVAGNYHGIGFYEYKGETFHPISTVPFVSSRFVLVDGSSVWVSHPYKGIFKVEQIQGKPVVKQYGKDIGITSVNNNFIFKIKNKLVLASENGMYEYNSLKDKFESSEDFNNLFGKIRIRYLKEDLSGNIWFVFQKNLGVVDMSGPKPTIIYIPELNNKMVSGFEHVYPVNAYNIFVGAEKGFFHINFEEYKKNAQKIQAGIRSVVAFNKKDSTLFGGYVSSANNEKNATVSYNWNTFHFEFSSTLFGQQSNIEYSYYLEGFEKNWSGWNKKTAKEYTNLPAGTYTFYMKARNNLGNESEPSSYSFKILPPWYQTPFAYAIYISLIIIGIYFLYYNQKKKLQQQHLKHNDEQKKLQYLHQLEMEHNEKQIVQLTNKNLESEIQHKNKELASVAMHLVQKGELLTKIKEELIRIKNQPENGKSPDNFKKIIKILNEEEKMNEDWEHFAVHFDKVHSDFLQALKEQYPNLSANELKLSAYLRMNLSSKEIAQLMNISVRGVEISRYRLRKKLEIPTEVNLFNFLMNFTAARNKNEASNVQIDISKKSFTEIESLN